jgi:hypothetical protein
MAEPQFNSKTRQALFIELASRPDGVTAQQVFEEAIKRGDTVTVEAFHNLGRRLAHRGLVVHGESSGRQTVFKSGAPADSQWLDDEQLASIIDPEYPLIAVTVMKEVTRELNIIPDAVWEEVRTRLRSTNARTLFFDGIKGYADDLNDALRQYQTDEEEMSASERARLRGEIEGSIVLLKGITKYGLGLSKEAIRIPFSFEAGLRGLRDGANDTFYTEDLLKEEIDKRVADEPFVVDVAPSAPDNQILIAAVDGASRGGLLAFEGENNDYTLGEAPAVSINTSIAQTNRQIKVGTREYPAFLRLPERPEDMQQRDNKYTIMATLFFPDLTEIQYSHSVWNAMNLLQSRAALKVMRRWETTRDALEVRPADVVLLPRPVVPQDRDSNHYAQSGSYGRIVRDLIEVSYDIMQKSRDDAQVIAGVVKNSPLRVLGPILNSFIVKEIAKSGGRSQLETWPLSAMNSLADRTILTRLLSAGRNKGDPWIRTCIVCRPFHATTDFAESYSREPEDRPSAVMLKRAELMRKNESEGAVLGEFDFWKDFRGEHDPFVRMLENAWYASFHLGAVPGLDQKQTLPRMEVLAVGPTVDDGSPFHPVVAKNCDKFLDALKSTGFSVSADHAMFGASGWIDVLPRLLVDVHYTVKVWASELQSRVREYIAFHVRQHLRSRSARGVSVRQWKPAELKAWASRMTEERRQQAGSKPAIKNDDLTGSPN